MSREAPESAEGDSQTLEAMLERSVKKGIEAALTDESAERFWNKGLEVLQRQAAEHAGHFVLGGLKKAIGVAVLVAAVWMLAGTPAAKAVLGVFLKP